MANRLLGKSAVVTGAASGMGKAIALAYLREGANVAATDMNEARLKELEQEVTELGLSDHFCYCAGNITVDEDCAAVVKLCADRFGTCNVLSHNAGVVDDFTMVDSVDNGKWDKVIAIKPDRRYTAISAVYPSMKANGYGRIVNVASVAAKRGGGLLGTSAYAASKAGVIGLTKAVAREGAPYGVACNGVCPSLTMTPMTANMGEEKTKKIIATIPLGRGAQPREIANMVLFYASDLASFATGEISDVDGGVTMDG